MTGKRILGIDLKSFIVGFSTCMVVAFYLNVSGECDTSLKHRHMSRDQNPILRGSLDAGQILDLPLTTVNPDKNIESTVDSSTLPRTAETIITTHSTKTVATTTTAATTTTTAARTPTVTPTTEAPHRKHLHIDKSSKLSTPISNKNNRGPRILCWIMTHYNNLMTKAVHVHDTWGQRCDKILFFLSNGTDPSRNETVKLLNDTHEKYTVNVMQPEQHTSREQVKKDSSNKIEIQSGYTNTNKTRSESTSPDKNSTENDYASSNRTLPIVVLDDIPEGRMHLLAKSNHAFAYIFEHHLNEFDWFLKADDDTYVVMENLRHFLSHSDANDPIYFGHHFRNLYIENGYNSGGSGYVLSREALKRFGHRHKTSKKCKSDGEDEDVEIGRCLEYLGVKVGKTSDEHAAVRFVCFTLEQRLMGKLPKWNKLVEAYTTKTGLASISSDVISFHYIEPWMMYALEYFVYKFKLRPEEV